MGIQHTPIWDQISSRTFTKQNDEVAEGIICFIEDVLVHGRMQEEHDERLHEVLRRVEESGMTLNKEKCIFSCTKVNLLGQILSEIVFHQTREGCSNFLDTGTN